MTAQCVSPEFHAERDCCRAGGSDPATHPARQCLFLSGPLATAPAMHLISERNHILSDVRYVGEHARAENMLMVKMNQQPLHRPRHCV
eukprot:2550108-Pyramimonas_sp.AAC.1